MTGGSGVWGWRGAALGLLPPLLCLLASTGSAGPGPQAASAPSSWELVIAQGEGLGLPTKFLLDIPPGFFTIDFEDLREYAAEYHPDTHRMVLNRALSFNSAAGTLKPLALLTHHEVATLYHELFHAFMNAARTPAGTKAERSEVERLLEFAREQQRCRYYQVEITPVTRRRSATQVRFLSERESWEALEETWAVFVGWAVWTKLEVGKGKKKQVPGGLVSRPWLDRLGQADAEGILIGYYEPGDPAERSKARKHYLAPTHRLSSIEIGRLMKEVLGEPAGEARQAVLKLASRESTGRLAPVCRN